MEMDKGLASRFIGSREAGWSLRNAISAIIALTALMAGGETAWPLIVVRQNEVINDNPAKLSAVIDIHRRYPGSCDEMWMADRDAFRTKDELKQQLEAIESHRAEFRAAGVKVAFQQGYDIGHWTGNDFERIRAAFPDGGHLFQRDRNGDEIKGILCPRAPQVLAWERDYTETVGRAIRPTSYWLDDDLRLGYVKPEGCFCERCVKAFNERMRGNLTREQLVRRLFGDAPKDPLRAEWMAFNADAIALFATAAREGLERAGVDCRMGYEGVSAGNTYPGWDFLPLLRALSGPKGKPVGMRPGAWFWDEEKPRDMIVKSLDVAREAERCRKAGFVGAVCYEEENYPRLVLRKSPGTIVVEASLALASGCDSLSFYWNDETNPEPIGEYERFAKYVAEARGYFAALAAVSRRTRLAGVARFVGSDAPKCAGFDIHDPSECAWAVAGVPISVMEAGFPLWYVTDKSRAEMGEGDAKRIEGHVANLPKMRYPCPSQAERLQALDEIDRVTGGKFPVRIDACRPLRILPRVDAAGRLECVTLLNCSVGQTDGLKVRVRGPKGASAWWQTPAGARTKLPVADAGAEKVVTVPSIPGWQIGTVFFE